MDEHDLINRIVNLEEQLAKSNAKFSRELKTIDGKYKKLRTENDQLKEAFQKRTIGTNSGMLYNNKFFFFKLILILI